VISFAEAADTADAVRLANASDYTLTAALFTRDVGAALAVAGAIRASAVTVNGSTVHPEPSGAEIGLGCVSSCAADVWSGR
jgi:acyl-CoA reductase-like NAD-dependent aldehyde dehydrogenase